MPSSRCTGLIISEIMYHPVSQTNGSNLEFIELFKRIDNSLWHQCEHNPVKLIGAVSQARLEDLALNDGFIYQLTQAAEKLKQQLRQGSQAWIDPYAATNPAEFFAVISEHFFERPLWFQQQEKGLYQQLLKFYRQDPAARLAI